MSEGIPSDWATATILELGNNHKDTVQTGPFGAQLHAEDYVEHGVPLILIRNIKDNGLDERNIPRISEEDARRLARYRLNVGDIVLSRVGRVGSSFLATERESGWVISGQTLRMRTDSTKIDPQYLNLALRTESVQREVIGDSVGTIRTSINTTILENITVNLPPKPEQQKIASILTSVDEVIEKTEAQINKLQDLKNGMMQELLTKGIGHAEFKDSPVGRIPKSWNVQPIRNICTDIVDCVNKTSPVVDYATPFKMIRTTNVRNGRVDTENVKYVTEDTYKIWTRRLIPKDGDLIFTREAPVGESGILRNAQGVFLGQRTMMYSADPRETNITYLMYSLHGEYCKRQLEDSSGGSTVAHMRVPDCEKILIKVPDIEEQNSIASAISSVDNKIENLQTKKRKLSSQKKALMQDLLTGKVRVTVN